MRDIYRLFYRQHGARFIGSLMTGKLVPITGLSREALLHVHDDGDGSPDIDTFNGLLQGYNKKILVSQIAEYLNPEGPYRKTPAILNTLTGDWRKKNARSFQQVPFAWKMTASPDQLIVLNYGYLDTVYRYMDNALGRYYRWANRWKTIFGTINQVAAESQRHQYIEIQLPNMLLGKTVLDRFSSKPFAVTMLNVFGNETLDGFMLLEFWRWIGLTDRNKSLLSAIEPKYYNRVNFLFKGKAGNNVLVNMAYLNSWIKGQPNATEIASMTQYPEQAIQKLFLRFCMTLNGVNLEAEPTEQPASAGQDVAQASSGPEEVKPATEEEILTQTVEDELTSTDPDDTVVDKGDIAAPVIGIKTDGSAKPVYQSEDKLEASITKADSSGVTDYTAELFEAIEEDIKALDRISAVQLKNRGVVIQEDHVGEIPEMVEAIDPETVKAEILEDNSPTIKLVQMLADHAEANLVTAADFRKMEQSIKAYDESLDPYGSGKPRKEARVITKEDTVITPEQKAIVVSDSVPDKTMASSALQVYNKTYVRNVMKKDILNAVDGLQAAGIIVRNHEITTSTTALGTYDHHKLELKPIDGQPSSISFTLPQVDEDGSFMAGGNKYLLRKSRVDVPIRKIAPSIVALSTYYGKTFVQISPKVANNSTSWLYRQINLAIVTEGSHIHSVTPSDVFDNEVKAPFIYGAIAAEFEKFSAGNLNFYFNYHGRAAFVEPEDLKKLETNGRVFCGFIGNKTPIVVDQDNTFIAVSETEKVLGDIYAVLQLPREKAPFDFSELRVFSKYVPVGVVLAYYLGFRKMLAFSGIKYRTVPARKNKELTPYEFAISFKDESYVFDGKNTQASLLLAGFTEYEKHLKLFESKLFDHKEVYLNLLMAKGLGSIYVRELDMMENAFVDPISKEILESLQEPTTFKGLLVRANEMLLTYHHPVSQDRSVMRDRGYERFAGIAYKELIKATRQFRNKNMAGRSKIDISPYEVWNAIMNDNSIKIAEDINPIQNLKEDEVITFAGEGGRNKETMTKPTRAFHKNDVGVLSESTVDSTSVGTIAYLSADPAIADVRGLMAKDKVLTPTSMMSTAALVSPASFTDNPKRIMFITTQHSHTVASAAYRQPGLRTGYENVIGKRTGKLFCTAAEEDGIIVSINDRGMVIKYASGIEDGIPLGRLYGKAEGSTYPHDVMTPLKPGAKFKKGDILAYNSKFFEPDFRNPKDVCLKMNTLATVAFIESPSTSEDAATISTELGQKLQTESVKTKSYIVNFGQNLRDVKKPGDAVGPRDVLMIIEDEITATNGSFSDESLEVLKRLSNAAPRAGVSGIIDRIEVFYHGEKRDMTASLRKIVDRSDAFFQDSCKASGKPVITGRVSEEYRVSGKPLELDKAEIRIYIAVQSSTGVGDKVVFGHQMKSTVSEVHRGQMYTEGGQKIDAVFSYRSVGRRGVHSPALMGTTSALLEEIKKRALNTYFGA